MFRTLTRRCVECSTDPPTCPLCKPGEVCTQKSGTCNECPARVCVNIADSGAPQPPAPKPEGGTNVGAIAGGVVGGVVFILLMTYLIWRFCIKNRREQYEEEYPENQEMYDEYQEKDNSEFNRARDARLSTHSVRSMASTVMTRASNVIQIAFIPGITDRSTHHESSIPPVPSIPLRQSSGASTPSSDLHPTTPYSDAQSGRHYFMPQDLRESHFSDFSSTDADTLDGRSTRHQSLASSLARESVASTVYHGEQTVQPQFMTRGKANVVSVKSSANNTPGVDVPQVPPIDYFKYGHKGKTAGPSKMRETSTNENGQAADSADHDETAVASEAAGPPGANHAPNHSQDSTGRRKSKSSTAVASAIQNATKHASRQPTHGGLGSLTPREKPEDGRDPSPFSDANAVHTP